MTPFPETEDMTVKRLYVALKRSDMQLLSMGAQKLHEKYCTGYKFQLLDDLKQISGFISNMIIPNDTKELLTNTISDILTNRTPFEEEQNSNPNQETGPIQVEVPPVGLPQTHEPLETEIMPISIQHIESSVSQENQNGFENNGEDDFKQDDTVNNNNGQEPPVIFTPQNVRENVQDTNTESIPDLITEEKQEENIQNEIKIQEFNSFEQKNEAYKHECLNNVAVFYDDKSRNIDYAKSKYYSIQLDLIGLDKESDALGTVPAIKTIMDSNIDEITNILNMLKTSKSDISFITTSKSEDILKTFVGNNINFELPLIKSFETNEKRVKIIPLFGLTNVFVCPKCGNREYFGGFHNKILTMQCKNCNGAMLPEVYEAEELATNSNPYVWLNAINRMAKSKVWILINPPLKSTKALVCEFLKTAYEISLPEKVYILSKETTRREYYKQMFSEINKNCIIKSEFTSEDALCESFINTEMQAG